MNCVSFDDEKVEKNSHNNIKNTSNVFIEASKYNSRFEDILRQYLKLKLSKGEVEQDKQEETENDQLKLENDDDDQYDDDYYGVKDYDTREIKKRAWRSWTKSTKRHHPALFKNSKSNGKRYNSNYNYFGRNMYYSGLQGN